ncbi:hypothetical protein PTKIN_Ptkin02bG0142800 [Pterospermum kingtungense]
MKCLIWNVRGFNYPLKQREVVHIIKSLIVDVVCLLETRVKHFNSQAIVNKFFSGWQWFHNYDKAYNGRIWLLCSNGLKMEHVASTGQSITCKVFLERQRFHFTAIYGSNNGTEKKVLWNHLQDIFGRVGDDPWSLAGDFNVVMHPSESSKFDGSQGLTSDMQDFVSCRSLISVYDHAFT